MKDDRAFTYVNFIVFSKEHKVLILPLGSYRKEKKVYRERQIGQVVMVDTLNLLGMRSKKQ